MIALLVSDVFGEILPEIWTIYMSPCNVLAGLLRLIDRALNNCCFKLRRFSLCSILDTEKEL